MLLLDYQNVLIQSVLTERFSGYGSFGRASFRPLQLIHFQCCPSQHRPDSFGFRRCHFPHFYAGSEVENRRVYTSQVLQ